MFKLPAHNQRTLKSDSKQQRGLTLIELVIVIAVIGLVVGFAAYRLGSVSFWREESFLRRFSEAAHFLHHQAVFEQTMYALEINLGDPEKTGREAKKQSYRIGIFQEKLDSGSGLAPVSAAALAPGLSGEFARFIAPPDLSDSNFTFSPSPSLPSLAEPVPLPEGMMIEDVRTMRGLFLAAKGGKIHIFFSPRGFSEFAVLHLRSSAGGPITILINPFTGSSEIYREYKEFKWTYGRKGRES